MEYRISYRRDDKALCAFIEVPEESETFVGPGMELESFAIRADAILWLDAQGFSYILDADGNPTPAE